MRPLKVNDWVGLKSHPAAEMFRLMDEDEFSQLLADIRFHGFDASLPIIIYQGLVLDGRNRLNACKVLKQRGQLTTTPMFLEWSGPGSPANWVVRANLHRRHLSASERATVAVELLGQYEEEAKERQREGGGDKRSEEARSVPAILPEPISKGEAREHAASVVGVSPRYVQEAKKLKNEAPQVYEAVKTGQMSIPQAKRQIHHQRSAPKPVTVKRQLVVCSDPIRAAEEIFDFFTDRELDELLKEINRLRRLPE